MSNQRTERLREIMRTQKMTAPDIAALIDRKPNTVRVWRCRSDNRVIPEQVLQLLEFKLAARGCGE